MKLFEQPFAFTRVEFRWASWPRSVVGCLLDRFEEEPIESVADRLLDNAVALSERIELISLFAPDRRENAFSWLLTLRLLTYLVELFKSDVVKPTHCWRYVLYQ